MVSRLQAGFQEINDLPQLYSSLVLIYRYVQFMNDNIMNHDIMNLDNFLCKYYYGISQICMLVTVTIIAVISFDRHYTIKYGSSTSSSMKYILASTACWIYSLLLSLPGL